MVLKVLKASIVFLILVFILIVLDAGSVMAKKNIRMDVIINKKKTSAELHESDVLKTSTISKQRVIKDFTETYKTPTDAKTMKIIYAGGIKNYTEFRGNELVPYQSHMIALITKLTDCDIIMKDIWEVYYYRMETEWIFQDIMQIKSTQTSASKKKIPVLGDSDIKKIISESLMQGNEGTTVKDITLLTKRGRWKLCTPQYHVVSKIDIVMKNDIHNTITAYECLIASTLEHENGAWINAGNRCTYKGKEIADCHIGTMCRELSKSSTIPPINHSDAETLLKSVFQQEYELRKNNMSIESFNLIKMLQSEIFGTTIPCVIRSTFSVDENKESKIAHDSTQKSINKTRAVYECIIYGRVRYSLQEQKWNAEIESCCRTGNEDCGFSCSNPGKGCKRLGEK